MNRQELVDMIESTFDENGTRSITGKALKMALLALTDNVSSHTVVVAITEADIPPDIPEEEIELGRALILTEEQRAANAAYVQAAKEAVENGSSLPTCGLDLSRILGAIPNEETGELILMPAVINPMLTIYITEDVLSLEDATLPEGVVAGSVVCQDLFTNSTILITPDGTPVMVEEQ